MQAVHVGGRKVVVFVFVTRDVLQVVAGDELCDMRIYEAMLSAGLA